VHCLLVFQAGTKIKQVRDYLSISMAENAAEEKRNLCIIDYKMFIRVSGLSGQGRKKFKNF